MESPISRSHPSMPKRQRQDDPDLGNQRQYLIEDTRILNPQILSLLSVPTYAKRHQMTS
jgi:hypothetical protein